MIGNKMPHTEKFLQVLLEMHFLNMFVSLQASCMGVNSDGTKALLAGYVLYSTLQAYKLLT